MKTIHTKYPAHCAVCQSTNRRDRDIDIGLRVAHLAKGAVMHISCYERATQDAAAFAASLPDYVEGAARVRRIEEHEEQHRRVRALEQRGFDDDDGARERPNENEDGGSIAEDMGDFSRRHDR